MLSQNLKIRAYRKTKFTQRNRRASPATARRELSPIPAESRTQMQRTHTQTMELAL